MEPPCVHLRIKHGAGESGRGFQRLGPGYEFLRHQPIFGRVPSLLRRNEEAARRAGKFGLNHALDDHVSCLSCRIGTLGGSDQMWLLKTAAHSKKILGKESGLHNPDSLVVFLKFVL